MCNSLQPGGLQHARLPVLHYLLEFAQPMSIESVMSSNHLILCCPLLLPSIFPSFRVFSNELALCIRWPKYWSFGFSISPFNEYSGLISFRVDWFDLLAVQVTLKSLLQYHSSKASILQHSAFFIVQLSHPYVTTGKNIALTRWTFVGKVMSLLFIYFYFILLYNTVLVLAYIDMNLPQVYMSSQSWTPLPPLCPYHLSGSSQCTTPKHPVSCIEPRLAIRFLHDSIHVSMPFSQIIPPSHSPTGSKSLFYTSVSLLLSCVQGYCYHLSKFHIYVLVYCIGVFLSGLLLFNKKWI